MQTGSNTLAGIFVGRQPIYNTELKVVAHELLFRSHDTDKSGVVDGEQATTQVILNTFLEIGLDRLIGDGLAFINLTRSFFLGDYPVPLPPERVVLEVLEDITIDDEFIAAVQKMSDQGYTIALDDVVNPEDVAPLLEIADIVKLEILGSDAADIRHYVSYMRPYNVKLLAEKIETHEEYELCKTLGFEYFQGYFLSRPNVVEGQRIPESRLTILQLLSELQKPDLEIRSLEKIIGHDVSLSYKLMRLINSAMFGTKERVGSLLQALTLLGIRQIKQWVSLIFLSKVEDKPRELLITSLMRAKMCELLAKALKYKNPDTGFTVGLFSVLDALLDLPLEDILGQLPLSDDINDALLRREGRYGTLLKSVIAYEKGEWEAVQDIKLDKKTITEAYLQSIDWTNTVAGALVDEQLQK